MGGVYLAVGERLLVAGLVVVADVAAERAVAHTLAARATLLAVPPLSGVQRIGLHEGLGTAIDDGECALGVQASGVVENASEVLVGALVGAFVGALVGVFVGAFVRTLVGDLVGTWGPWLEPS